jgi:hypothetical protein
LSSKKLSNLYINLNKSYTIIKIHYKVYEIIGYSNIENLVLWDRRRSRIAGIRARWLCLGVLRLGEWRTGVRDEQNKTNTFGCRNTAGGSHCFFLAVDGAISHLYNRLQSAMVQGFLK